MAGESGITLAQLRLLVELDEHRSLERIADLHGNTPIAIRSMLRRLGAACGEAKPLFRAAGTGQVELTARGHQLLTDAKHILALVDRMSDKDRPITVAAYSTIMLQLFELFSPNNEQLPFQFLAGTDAARAQSGALLTDQLHTHAADIVIAPAEDHPEFESYPLYSWALRAVQRGGSAAHPVPIESLQGRQLLVSPRGHRSRRLLEESAHDAGISLTIRLDLADHGVMRNLALRSGWIAVIPDDAFGTPMQDLGAVIERRPGVRIEDRYALYHRKTSIDEFRGERESKVLAVAANIVKLLSESAVKARRQKQ